MKTTPLLLIGILLVGCGGGGGEEASPSPKATAAAPKAADAEGQIRDAFTSYNAALLDRDFDKACSYLAPETTDKLHENVQKLNLPNTPDDCAGLLDVLYEQIDKVPDQKKLVEDVLTSAKLDKVKVTGQKATLDWHATVSGNKQAISQTARIVDGEWKLVDVTN